MSASDAKESIVMGGGSLKERMAALQGRGGFGGAPPPPPLAPKPAVEKPKWKPPPVVRAPTPDEADEAEPSTGHESAKSPPAADASTVEEGSEAPAVKEESESAADAADDAGGEGAEAEASPEEEERQRRANIAARMARLGGARVGMAPPVFGKKPVVAKKPEVRKEELPKAEVPEPAAERPDESQTEDASADKPDEAAHERKSSESATEAPQGARLPSSMPVPAGPRRAAPPRKKAIKSPTPPAQSISGELANPETAESSDQSATGERPANTEAPNTEITGDSTQAGEKDEGEPVKGAEPEVAEDVADDSEKADKVDDGVLVPEVPAEHEQPETTHTHVEDLVEPSNEEVEETGEAEKADEMMDSTPEAAPEVTSSEKADDEDAGPPADVKEVSEEEDEVARRKRIAEKVEKMGGFNPFAQRPTPPRVLSTETVEEPDSDLPAEEQEPKARRQASSHSQRSGQKASLDRNVDGVYSASFNEPEETEAVRAPERIPSVGSIEFEKGTILEGTTKEDDENDNTPGVINQNRDEHDSIDEQKYAKDGSDSSDADNELPPHTADSSQDVSFEQDNAGEPTLTPTDTRNVPPPAPETASASTSRSTPVLSSSITDLRKSDGGSPSPKPMPAFARIVPYLPDEDEQSARGSETDHTTSPPAHTRLIPYSADDDEREEDQSKPLVLPPPVNRAARPPQLKQVPPPRPKEEQDVAERATPPAAPSRVQTSQVRGEREDDALPVLYPVPKRAVPPARPTPTPQIAPPRPPSPKAEVLDESEGDPIDPGFHSPSRRASPTRAAPVPLPPATSTSNVEDAEDADLARRRTIAERMQKLGGLRFGAPAPPARPPPPPQVESSAKEEGTTPEAAEQPAEVELTEEEEERARKQRIAAKMAGMGGMRFGMMPTGAPQPMIPRRQASEDKVLGTPPPPPQRAVPPARPPPPPAAVAQDPESEHESVGTSDEGVRVEAEESEIEEVTHEDAEEVEEAPPPIPNRAGRRESLPPPRPPAPTPLTQSRKATEESGTIRGAFVPQTEYVMVEEPEVEPESAPPPPRRPSTRVPPPRAVPLPPPSQATQEQILSPWELPSIPSAALDMSIGEGGDSDGGVMVMAGSTDLDMSASGWSEDSSAYPPPQSPPATLGGSFKRNSRPESQIPSAPTAEHSLSADELMAVWGRVGVQICEAATTLFDSSKKGLVGDGTFRGFIDAVLSEVPNAARPPANSAGGGDIPYGALVYHQIGTFVQKRVSEIMPGDIVFLQDAKLKGYKGLQTYHQNVGITSGSGSGGGEPFVGVVGEFEPKKTKIRAFQANQHVGQQSVESVSYRLEDLKSGVVKVFRVLET